MGFVEGMNSHSDAVGICWHKTPLCRSWKMSFHAADASWILKRAGGLVKRTSQELLDMIKFCATTSWCKSCVSIQRTHKVGNVSCPHVAKTCKNYCPQKHYVCSPPHDFCSILWWFNILSAYVCSCLSEPQPLPTSSQLLRTHALLPVPKASGMPL